MTKRKSLTRKIRAEIFSRHSGVCDICSGKINGILEAWEVSHRIPLAIGGADDESNWFPVHAKCHKQHTSAVDIPVITKVERLRLKHMGIRPQVHRKIQSQGFQKPRYKEQ